MSLTTLWGQNTTCTTTITDNSGNKTFTLNGGPAGLKPFSYNNLSTAEIQTLVQNIKGKSELCNSHIYSESATSGNSDTDLLHRKNIELNGLTAQYSIFYNQYTHLISVPPANIITTSQTVLNLLSELNTARTITDNSANIIAKELSYDAAVEVAAKAVADYTNAKTSLKSTIDALYANILNLATAINTGLKAIQPIETANETRIEENVSTLLQTMDEMNQEMIRLTAEQGKPKELDGNAEDIEIKTNSKFLKYICYFLFTAFVVGCLIFLNYSPTEGKLDMFILALAVVIAVYYIYDYFQPRMK